LRTGCFKEKQEKEHNCVRKIVLEGNNDGETKIEKKTGKKE
jgi:hypothetical protein